VLKYEPSRRIADTIPMKYTGSDERDVCLLPIVSDKDHIP
jgi:hypothetical protein